MRKRGKKDVRIIDANALKDKGWKVENEGCFYALEDVVSVTDIDDAPTIPTKQIKYFDEDERVWKIGSVIVE